MGVGTRVGVAVGSGVEVTVGVRDSIGRGVVSGWGGVLIHAASMSDKKTSHAHFTIFMPRART